MFCPSAVDWGNVADWVAGIGAILVGVGALTIALLERRRAVSAEARIEVLESEKHNSLIIPALRFIQQMQMANSGFLREAESGNEFADAKKRWLRMLRVTNERALRMQHFPHSSPELYAEYEELASLTDGPENMVEWAKSTLVDHARRLEDNLRQQYESLFEMRDERTVLKW